jgi:hypothetical protein
VYESGFSEMFGRGNTIKTLHLEILKDHMNVITCSMSISPNMLRSSNASTFQKTALHSLVQDNLDVNDVTGIKCFLERT